MYVQGTHSDRINAIDWKREWEGEVLLTHMSSNRGGGGGCFVFQKFFACIKSGGRSCSWNTYNNTG